MPRHRARARNRAPRRAYLVLTATVVILVLAVVAVRLATGGTSLARTDAAAGPASSSACPGGAGCPSPAGRAQPSATPAATSSPARSRKPATPRPTRRPARTPVPSPSASPTSARPAPQPSPSASTAAGAAASVLALINQARAQAGLPAYTVTSGLDLSSSRHNQLMAAGCGLSHQCPGEASLGDRETAAGVHWTAAGENIGEGGPVADSESAIAQMAVGLTQDMLNEKPPDDGHRLNILSSSFTHIGITVQWSANGTVWMTQDFSN
jgi:uncharacterized protein YkwD